jgi:hypothetical protein
MLLFMGRGASLAAYYRRRRVAAIEACAQACDDAARHARDSLRAGAGDRDALSAALAHLDDCRAFCALAAGLVARKSPLAAAAASACAAACRACAAACGGHSGEAFARCVAQCDSCAMACEAVAGSQAA